MPKILSALLLLTLMGCANLESRSNEPIPECVTPPKAPSDYDKLLSFANQTASLPPSARLDVCQALQKQHKESADPFIRLQLLVARPLSEGCGDITKLLEEINTLTPGLQDDALKQYVHYHTEVLKLMAGTSKKLGSLERKQKKFQSVLDNKENNTPKANETRLLREKLEAIRSMEKQLDETNDSK